MIKYKTITKQFAEKDSIVCDICGKEYSYDLSSDRREFLEEQEFIHIHHRGGYGSIFGDSISIDVDICQHCFKKHIVDNKIK